MSTYGFKVTLISDCEAGSGFGSEILNSLLPRNHEGLPYLPASHIKGLMRDSFRQTVEELWPDKAEALCDALLGREGAGGDDGMSGCIRLSDTTIEKQTASCTLHIARTALNLFGTAKEHSLRTSEALSAGTVFNGRLMLDCDEGDWRTLASQLALLSISAVGGNRTRGAGACIIGIEGCQDSPGDLLRKLGKLIEANAINASPNRPQQVAGSTAVSNETVFVKITFTASAPVCCPETPVVSNNVIESGFAIPASAVQGAILTKLDVRHSALASACFAADTFRVWPLHPASDPSVAMSYRISATHKISKLPNEKGAYTLIDLFLSAYDWRDVAKGSPLKGTDGVLMQDKAGRVNLWRSQDMARIVTGHSVHNDAKQNRNLYTVESMAPTTYIGLGVMPREAFVALKECLTNDPCVTFGKARTVRGNGELSVEEMDQSSLMKASGKEPLVFILQSPVVVPETFRQGHYSGEEILAKVVIEAGWGQVKEASASISVRFGWNRHGKGTCVNESKRLGGIPVIMPGSVFKMEQPVSHLAQKLIAGLGQGKDQGFGAVLPHPGEATERFSSKADPKRFSAPRETHCAAKEAWDLLQHTKGKGLSTSQISALIAQRMKSVEAGKAYLVSQIRDRPKVIADRWNENKAQLSAVLEKQEAISILEIWRDLQQENVE